MLVILLDKKGGLHVFDPLGEAKTGRWCKPPLEPDRCERCLDPQTMAHYEAEGYYTDKGGWRHGVCHRCPAELREKAVWYERR